MLRARIHGQVAVARLVTIKDRLDVSKQMHDFGPDADFHFLSFQFVRRHGVDAADQAQRVIDTDAHLHAKVPLVGLLGLMHFQITPTALVLGITPSRNNGDIDNATLAQHQAISLQLLIHVLEQSLT